MTYRHHLVRISSFLRAEEPWFLNQGQTFDQRDHRLRGFSGWSREEEMSGADSGMDRDLLPKANLGGRVPKSLQLLSIALYE